MADSTTGQNAAGYRVLARKYRPKTFADLIGQEALVRTLANAFTTGRIAQAYMLTGVRGVGKTTTARLIARALNYPSGPSIDMPEMTAQCEAILESRHMDVIEMDAASNTGVDNMREIIDSVRYAPVSLRTKVYIIDEVHMLSKSAFNALLKTLEEPPPHVKFIFATTEIRKVPVTIISRCQRFDLRRMDVPVLMTLYGKVAQAEGAEAEEDALRMIARAAEGSARDGLSLLDQAIAYGNGKVLAADVTSMLGLAGREQVADLFETVMSGRVAEALARFKAQHDAGADPETILTDLADFVHWVTRLRVAKDAALLDGSRTAEEKTRGVAFAEKLGVPVLTRAWQMLLKGISETAMAPEPAASAEMVLIRLGHAATLPGSDELVKLARAAGSAPVAPKPTAAVHEIRSAAPPPAEGNLAPARQPLAALPPEGAPPAAPALSSFASILAMVRDRRDVKLATELETWIRPISVSEGKIELALEPGAPHGLPGELGRKLEAWTGRRWMVMVAKSGGSAPVAQVRREAKDQGLRTAREHADVQAFLSLFPGSTIVDVKPADTPSLPTEETDEEPQ